MSRGRKSSGFNPVLFIVVLIGFLIASFLELPLRTRIGIISIIIFVPILIVFLILISRKGTQKKRCTNYQFINIDRFDGIQFERFCAQLLADNGYSTKVTKATGDYGVDIIANKNGKKYAIQVKCYHKRVGNRAVQEVYSGKAYYGADVAYVMTNSYFTAPAKNLASRNGVGLWDRNYIFQLMSNAIDKYGVKVDNPTYNQSISEVDKKAEEQPPYNAVQFDHNKKVYLPGCFIIGKELNAGKYVFIADGELGRVEIYNSLEDYENDEMPEVHTFKDEYRRILSNDGVFVMVEDAIIQPYSSNR